MPSNLIDVATVISEIDGVRMPLQPASAAPRLEFIDGLRGIAMLMVLLFHSYVFGGEWQIPITFHGHTTNLCSVFGIGSVGVSLFLVLSGFCLFWPFARSASNPGVSRPEPTLREFASRRCRRILPPYYIAVVAFTVLSLVERHFGPSPPRNIGDAQSIAPLGRSFLAHLLMLHNMRPEYFYDINGSFWSLALEFHLYLLFPILVVAFRKFPKLAILGCLFAFSCAFRFFALRNAYMEPNEYVSVLTYSVFGRCFEFGLGMYAASFIARAAAGGGPSLAAARRDIVAAAALFLIAVVGYKNGYAEVFKAALTGLLFVTILIAAARRGSLLNRILSSGTLVTLGTISYSIYLIHHPVVTFFGAFAAQHFFSNVENMLLMWLIVIPLCVLLGAVYYRFVEKRFIGAPKRSGRRENSRGVEAAI